MTISAAVSARRPKPYTDPAVIRQVLADLRHEHETPLTVAKRAGVGWKSVYRWRRRAEEFPGWPDQGDVTAWHDARRLANRAKTRAYVTRRHRNGGRLLVGATGVRRRVQALAALGWSYAEIGAAMGRTARGVTVGQARVWQLAVGYDSRTGTVLAETRDAVIRAYDELSMTRPEGWTHDRSRRVAAAKGWVPPLAWDDDEIDDPKAQPRHRTSRTRRPFDAAKVERRLAGDRIRLNHTEATEVVRRLKAQGVAPKVIEDVYGFKLERYRGEGSAA